MGALKHFFNNRDVDKNQSGNPHCRTTQRNPMGLQKLEPNQKQSTKELSSWSNHFGHLIEPIREQHIKTQEVRGVLCNIPNINAFIIKCTATYIEKKPIKFLTAWIHRKRKMVHHS